MIAVKTSVRFSLRLHVIAQAAAPHHDIIDAQIIIDRRLGLILGHKPFDDRLDIKWRANAVAP